MTFRSLSTSVWEESFTIHGNLWQDLQLIAHHVPIKSKSLICKLLLQISSVSPNNVSCWLSRIGKSYEMSYVFLPSFSEALIDLNATHAMESQECQPYWVKPFKEDHGLPPKSEKASFTSWRASFELAVEKALASNLVRRRQAEREVLCQWWGGGAEHTVMSELSPPILMHACPPERVPPFLSSKGGRTTSGTRHARLCQHAAAGTHDINMHGAKKLWGRPTPKRHLPFLSHPFFQSFIQHSLACGHWWQQLKQKRFARWRVLWMGTRFVKEQVIDSIYIVGVSVWYWRRINGCSSQLLHIVPVYEQQVWRGRVIYWIIKKAK